MSSSSRDSNPEITELRKSVFPPNNELPEDTPETTELRKSVPARPSCLRSGTKISPILVDSNEIETERIPPTTNDVWEMRCWNTRIPCITLTRLNVAACCAYVTFLCVGYALTVGLNSGITTTRLEVNHIYTYSARRIGLGRTESIEYTEYTWFQFNITVPPEYDSDECIEGHEQEPFSFNLNYTGPNTKGPPWFLVLDSNLTTCTRPASSVGCYTYIKDYKLDAGFGEKMLDPHIIDRGCVQNDTAKEAADYELVSRGEPMSNFANATMGKELYWASESQASSIFRIFWLGSILFIAFLYATNKHGPDWQAGQED